MLFPQTFGASFFLVFLVELCAEVSLVDVLFAPNEILVLDQSTVVSIMQPVNLPKKDVFVLRDKIDHGENSS